MLGIQIDGEFLDLVPGTTLDLEAENPFLQFETNDMIGEYSLPFQVISNEKNNRLLGYAGIGQMRVDNTAVDAILYDNSLQIGAGSVKKEKLNVHLNKVSKGLLNCYYLSKASGFWQDAKDKKMRDIDVGGDRSFAWAGLSTITDGFWKHIHDVVASGVNAYDYAFYPVQNQGWAEGEVYPPVMNMMYYDSGEANPVRFPTTYVPLDVRERNRIVPFPYLHYVLRQAISYCGWTIEGAILEDEDFMRATMVNFRAIDWCFVTVSSGVASATYRDPVVFNLQDHLPDITISQFLLALRDRFGWRFDFNNITKKITVYPIDELTTAAATDFTTYSTPLIVKNIEQEVPVYALRNDFAAGLGGGAPNLSVVELQGSLDSVADLPTAAEALYAYVYLITEENNYYICQQNQDTEAWEWIFYAYNIYDYEPEGFNKEIKTAATTVGNEYYSEYLDFIPRIDNQGEWMGRTEEAASWGIHLLFYYGLRDNKSGDEYPFASHHVYDSTGVQVGNWSLAFKAELNDGTQVGLFDLNWKNFLNMLNSAEEIEHTLHLPLDKYLQLRFSDRIIIDGIELFVKQIKSSIPYKGIINCVSIRI